MCDKSDISDIRGCADRSKGTSVAYIAYVAVSMASWADC